MEKDINTQIYDKYIIHVYLSKYVMYFDITITKHKIESCLGKEYCFTTMTTKSLMLMMMMMTVMMMMMMMVTTTILIIIITPMVMS